MPERILLDTSAYAHLRANHEKVVERVAKADIVLLPAVVIGELCAGIHLGRHGAENRAALTDFLDEPFVATVQISQDIAERYGQIFADLRRAGTPIPTNDIWIAACAFETRSHLLTFDSDFGRIRKLERTIYKS